MTSLQDDIAATKRILNLQPGPCILVAHSYGGTVITEAGTDPHVIALVYIAAHEPNAGETEASNGKRFPSATSKTNAIEKTPDGYTYLDPAAFPQAFGADLPPEEAEFEANARCVLSDHAIRTGGGVNFSKYHRYPCSIASVHAFFLLRGYLFPLYRMIASFEMYTAPGQKSEVYLLWILTEVGSHTC